MPQGLPETDMFSPAGPVDRPGVLDLAVTRSGRDFNFVFSVSDPDGIRSLSTATVTATDGTVANALGDFSRSDANTFAGRDSRRNARWASGIMRVTYVDATSGRPVSLTRAWGGV